MKIIETSGVCPRCNGFLYFMNGKLQCYQCESVISIDKVKYTDADWFELNIPYTLRKFNNRLTQLQELTSKYNATFLGFDEFDSIGANNFSGMLDIGWDDAFPDTLPQFIKELKRILR